MNAEILEIIWRINFLFGTFVCKEIKISVNNFSYNFFEYFLVRTQNKTCGAGSSFVVLLSNKYK